MFVLLFLIMFLIFLFAGLQINEVMANPRGSSGAGYPEDRNEYVEIYNTGPETIDIRGYFISDGDARDSIVPFSSTINDTDPILNSTILPPNSYGVILDPEYPDSGNGEYVMPYNFPPGCVLLTVGNTTIGDGLSMTDSVYLISPSGDTISTYNNPISTPDGYSVERVNPYLPDTPQNWGVCQDTSGGTPGRQNSIYRPPSVSIDTLYIKGDTLI